MEQRTADWYAARCGKVTASRLAEILPLKSSGKWGVPRGTYMEQIIAERLTGRTEDKRRIPDLERRANLEPEARDAYSFFTDNDVELVGFVDHPTIGDAGASPDGLVGKDGMIEIKCPDATRHIKLLSGDDSGILKYLPQIHFQLACTGRKWCDFVSYSPFMPSDLKLFTRRIVRDEVCIKGLEDHVRIFLGEVEEKLAAVLALCQKVAA